MSISCLKWFQASNFSKTSIKIAIQTREKVKSTIKLRTKTHNCQNHRENSTTIQTNPNLLKTVFGDRMAEWWQTWTDAVQNLALSVSRCVTWAVCFISWWLSFFPCKMEVTGRLFFTRLLWIKWIRMWEHNAWNMVETWETEGKC